MIFFLFFLSCCHGVEHTNKSLSSDKIDDLGMAIRKIDILTLKHQDPTYGTVNETVPPVNHQISIEDRAPKTTDGLLIKYPSPFNKVQLLTPVKLSKNIDQQNINYENHQAYLFQLDLKNLRQRYANLEKKNDSLKRQNNAQEISILQLKKQIEDIHGEKSQLFQELIDEKQKNIQLEKQIQAIGDEKSQGKPLSRPRNSSGNFISLTPLVIPFTPYKSPLKCFLDDKNVEINNESFLRDLNKLEQHIGFLLKDNRNLREINNDLIQQKENLMEHNQQLQLNQKLLNILLISLFKYNPSIQLSAIHDNFQETMELIYGRPWDEHLAINFENMGLPQGPLVEKILKNGFNNYYNK